MGVDLTGIGLDSNMQPLNSPMTAPINKPEFDDQLIGLNSNIISNQGITSANNFFSITTSHSTSDTFTTTSYVDLTGQSQTFILSRSILVIITVTITMFLTESVGNTGDANVTIDIDGVVNNQGLIVIRSGNNAARTYSVVYPTTISSGTHTIKLKAKFDGISAGSPVLNITESYMTRLYLGT